MAAKLTISDWRSVLIVLKEFTKPYQLGIQLGIDPSELDEIEKDHPRDVDRQKTEMIKYWLHNLPDASWATLANAMERMGGHAWLVEALRKQILGEIEQNGEQISSEPSPLSVRLTSFSTPVSEEREERTCIECLEGVPFSILLLGKKGHGKSTLGNRLLNSERYFRINNHFSPQICKGSAVLKSVSQHKTYSIEVCDLDGFFEGHCSNDYLSSTFPAS